MNNNIGKAIKALYRKIYNQGDDAIEFMYYDSPIFAQYWDEYEGDLDSIIAEVDPSELQIILDELTAAAEDQGVAEGFLDKAKDAIGWLQDLRGQVPSRSDMLNNRAPALLKPTQNPKEFSPQFIDYLKKEFGDNADNGPKIAYQISNWSDNPNDYKKSKIATWTDRAIVFHWLIETMDYVESKYPDENINSPKMARIVYTLLGYKLWTSIKQGVAEAKAATARFRTGNKKRAELNAMSDEERRAYDKEQQEKQRKRDDARLERERQKLAAKKGVAETRLGNRMSDMSVGSPKIVHKNGKAVGEIGLDHDPSPGQGPYYMKHYETNTWYSGYDTKQEALADLKHCVEQMNEGAEDRKRNALWAQITSYEKRAKETKNDVKKQHLLKMADELRGKLSPTKEEKLAESLAALEEAIQAPAANTQQVAAAKAAAPYGYNTQTGKPNPAPAATAQPAQPAQPAATTAPAQPAQTVQQQADAKQQALLDRMGKRFGLAPGATIDQVQAAQQAHLDKNDPAAAAQYKQNMANIDAGNTAANKPVQLTPKPAAAPQTMQQRDPNFYAGLQAAKAGGSPVDIMLAQPNIANNQQYLDSIGSAYGLPAGSTVEQIKAAAAKPVAAPAAAPVDAAGMKAAAEQKAIDDMAAKHGLPAGLTQDEFMKQWAAKNAPMAPGVQQPAAAAPAAPAVAEGKAKKAERPEADYGDDYQAMVGRLKQLAGAGPLKTVYDPQKRVYKNVPQAVQPKK